MIKVCGHCQENAEIDQGEHWCQNCCAMSHHRCAHCGHAWKHHTFQGYGNGKCAEATPLGRCCICKGWKESGKVCQIWE